jgi:maltose alpha-D-glucosyltransferase/alpha-amylase
MCNSNWEKHEDRYYFHRFFEFQPDLNYRNPNVLLDMCRNFMFWMEKGVDGFRADAIPFLWKEEGTDCENLEGTHTIVKFFRAVIEYLKPNTLLLAEACQSPTEIVNYMNDGDECNSAYHFPLMSQIFNAITSESSQPIINILQPEITPTIPENCQWFTFLRCHDQLSLESVCISEEDRKLLHSKYCHNPDWDFMMGQGISARLSELFKFNPDKVLLAYSILLTLPGTPIIFYGDEFAKSNDLEFYKQQIQLTGHDDTRNLARGRVDWEKVNLALKKEKSIEFIVFNNLKKMIKARKEISAISLGDFEFIETKSDILSYTRKFGDDEFIVIQNLSANRSQISNSTVNNYELIIGSYELENKNYFIKGHHYLWLKKIN